jgi:hypothetical protein
MLHIDYGATFHAEMMKPEAPNDLYYAVARIQRFAISNYNWMCSTESLGAAETSI